MSANVGLPTPRGSGTSGYVQRNLSYLRPRDPLPSRDAPEPEFRQRQPNKEILEHDRRRAIEVKILEERDRLEEENEKLGEEGKVAEEGEETAGEKVILTEEQIEERLDKLREKLTKELEDELAGRTQPGRRGRFDGPPKERRQFKAHQVHEQAEAKIQETERFRRAVKIRTDEDAPRDSYRGRRDDYPPPPPRRDDERREREGGERHRDSDKYHRHSRRRRSYSASRSRSPPAYRDLDRPTSPGRRDRW
ncbi:RNA-splicing factor [Ascosphaera atra]|nr:RNA-splicing factor [Ascosphaera atra]